MTAGEGSMRDLGGGVLEEQDLPKIVVTKSEALLWRLEGLEKAHKAAVKAHEASAAGMRTTVRDAMRELREEWREDRRDFMLEAREVGRADRMRDFSQMGAMGLVCGVALVCAIALGVWLHATVLPGVGREEPGDGSLMSFLGARGGLHGWLVERLGEEPYTVYVTDDGHVAFGPIEGWVRERPSFEPDPDTDVGPVSDLSAFQEVPPLGERPRFEADPETDVEEESGRLAAPEFPPLPGLETDTGEDGP